MWDLEACEVVAGLYRVLHVPALPQLRLLTSYAARRADALARLPRSAPLPRRLVEEALSISRDFASDPGTTGTLIHGDLHYENVMASDREPWLAIDPKPLNGDPHYELAPMLLNRFDELAGSAGGTSVRKGIRLRFHALVDHAGLEERRARDWVVVRMLDYACERLQDPPGAQRATSTEEHLTMCIAVAKAVQDQGFRQRAGSSRRARRRGVREARIAGRRAPGTLGPMPQVISVNVGRVRTASWAGIGRTAMDKQSVRGLVAVNRLGLDGDQVGDTKHHGGVDQAVYAFAREDLDWWEAELGQEIRNGQFAENLTTRGIDVNESEVGERWRIGTATFELAMVRIPCNDFKSWQQLGGYESRAWVRRFAQQARPGPYLRVLQEGELRVGDDLAVVHQPGHGVTVSTMFRALTTERGLLPELARVDNLARVARARLDAFAEAL